MVRLEQIDFKSQSDLITAIEKTITKDEVFRDYKDKNGEIKQKKLISNNHLYLGNNFYLTINKDASTGKVYLSIDYYSIEDRFEVAKNKKGDKL